MRKIVMFLIVIFSFVIFCNDVSAEVCDYADVERLKQLANMIDVNYEYIDDEINSDDDGDYGIVDSYRVFVGNITQELYVKKGLNEYRYSDMVEGSITFSTNSGQVQLFVYTDRCPNKLLRTITLDLPKFNVYSYRRECKELEELNLDFCDEWYQGYLDDEIFSKFVEPYYINNNEDEVTFLNKFIQFLRQNYVYLVGAGIIIVGIVVLLIRHRKRSVLE